MKVRAFTDFWLDCYSTMLFSLLLSAETVDKACLYCNNYTYRFAEIADLLMNRVRYGVLSSTDTTALEKSLLYDEETIFLNILEAPIEEIKRKIDDGKIVMAGVDLYYWVNDTFHFEKNHVLHYSLVFAYDDSRRELLVLETGESGNREYRVSYEQAEVAIKAYDDYSKSYRVSTDLQKTVLTKETVTANAIKIIESIDFVLEQDEKILNTSGLDIGGILYMNDMVQTHMFNMSNRSRVNYFLFKHVFSHEPVDGWKKVYGNNICFMKKI